MGTKCLIESKIRIKRNGEDPITGYRVSRTNGKQRRKTNMMYRRKNSMSKKRREPE